MNTATQTSPPFSMIPSAGSTPLSLQEKFIGMSPDEALELYVNSRNSSNMIRKAASSPMDIIKLREMEVLNAIKALEYRMSITDDPCNLAALNNMQVIIQTRWHLPGEFRYVVLQSLRMLWSWHIDRLCKQGRISSRHMLDELDHFINRLNAF